LSGLWTAACSRTAAAWARCPIARNDWAYLIAASASVGLARYRTPQVSISCRHSTLERGAASGRIDPVVSDVDVAVPIVVEQPPAAKAAPKTAVIAAEARRRAGDRYISRRPCLEFEAAEAAKEATKVRPSNKTLTLIAR
jgi:hypothetical protein